MSQKIEAGQRWFWAEKGGKSAEGSVVRIASFGEDVVGFYWESDVIEIFDWEVGAFRNAFTICPAQQVTAAQLLLESPEADTFTVTRSEVERWRDLENQDVPRRKAD